MHDHPAIRDWLKLLAGTVQMPSGMGKEELQTKIGLYASMLAEEFGADAFTAASLRHVASKCTFFPSFGEICAALQSLLDAGREDRRLRLEYPGKAVEAEPYKLPPPPEWCFEGKMGGGIGVKPERVQTNYLTRGQLNEAYRRAGVKGPQLPEPKVVPLRTVAAETIQEVKRGPVLDE